MSLNERPRKYENSEEAVTNWRPNTFRPIKFILEVVAVNVTNFVASYPRLTMVCGIISVTSILINLKQIDRMITDDRELFGHAQGKAEQLENFISGTFPQEFFDPIRSVERDFIYVMFFANDEGTIFRRTCFKEIVLFDSTIRGSVFDIEGKNYSFEDICAKDIGGCLANRILELDYEMENFEKIQENFKYPIYPRADYDLHLPQDVGGVLFNHRRGVDYVKVVRLAFYFDPDVDIEIKRKWKYEFLDYMSQNFTFKFVQFHYLINEWYTEQTNQLKNARMTVPLGFILIMVVSTIFTLNTDCVLSKPYFGVVTTVSLVICAFNGLAIAVSFGYPMCVVNIYIPLVASCILLGDQYMKLSCIKNTFPSKQARVRILESYQQAFVPSFITATINVITTFITSLSPFKGISILCFNIAWMFISALIFHYTLLGIFDYCFLKAEERKLNSYTFKPSVTRIPAHFNKSKLFRYLFTTDEENKHYYFYIEDFLKIFLETIMHDKILRRIMYLLYILYIFLFLNGWSTLKYARNPEDLISEQEGKIYSKLEAMYLRQYYDYVQIIFKRSANYCDYETRNSIINVIERLWNKTSYVDDGSLSYSWLHTLTLDDSTPENIYESEESFVNYLKNVFLRKIKNMQFEKDIVFSPNDTKILSTRIIICLNNTFTINDITESLAVLTDRLDLLPYVQGIYSHVYHPFEINLNLRPFLLLDVVTSFVATIVFWMVVVSNPISLFAIIIMNMSILCGVLGFISLWDVPFTISTYCSLLICICYSVTHSVHLMYAFVVSELEVVKEKFVQAVLLIGQPQALTTLTILVTMLPMHFSGILDFIVYSKALIVCSLITFIHTIIVMPIFYGNLLDFFRSRK